MYPYEFLHDFSFGPELMSTWVVDDIGSGILSSIPVDDIDNGILLWIHAICRWYWNCEPSCLLCHSTWLVDDIDSGILSIVPWYWLTMFCDGILISSAISVWSMIFYVGILLWNQMQPNSSHRLLCSSCLIIFISSYLDFLIHCPFENQNYEMWLLLILLQLVFFFWFF